MRSKSEFTLKVFQRYFQVFILSNTDSQKFAEEVLPRISMTAS
jgi:hypothetical protein